MTQEGTSVVRETARGATVDYVEIAKIYGSVNALLPTSMTIEAGEFFSIIGPSGSGKTTLLGVTAGFIPPSSGQILVDGRDLIGVPPFKRNIGMVFQNYSLFPHMNVAENIGFPLRMRKVGRSETAERVDRMLAMVRLEGMGERRPLQLSGGQQQRVALARAAVYNPLLLLMDEPLSALDKNLREEMQYEVKRFQEALGATVLYVTHDQGEAASMSHRIAIINEGRIEQFGTARKMYERPNSRFVASFLGEANIFEVAELERRGEGAIAVTPEGLRFAVQAAPATEGPLCICVRPESIALSKHTVEAADNCLTGTLVDVTYTAGSIRYKVEVRPGLIVSQRMALVRQVGLLEAGAEVHLHWSAADTLLIDDSRGGVKV